MRADEYINKVIECKFDNEKKVIIEDILGKHNVRNNGELLYKTYLLAKTISTEYANIVMETIFAPNRHERYEKYIKPMMKEIDSATFFMGSDKDDSVAYCGETPKHKINLSSYMVSKIPVTEKLYRLYDSTHSISDEKDMPVTNVTWYDAYMYSYWMGSRLLTEAEWEYACRSKSESHWCCAEDKLNDFAWYSENSNGEVHSVAEKKSNDFGLFDMHGNVWEWCADSYEEDFYENSKSDNPCNEIVSKYKVCRGGSIHAFSEMCRNEFRSYETAAFNAYDLGIRLAKDVN